MLRVASDEELRRELARRGIARASRFTWRACAEKTRGVYLGQRTTDSGQRAR